MRISDWSSDVCSSDLSVVRSHYEHGSLPWANAAISGFIVDPDRKKLSKSAGNMPDDPVALIERHGADAVRYWSANGRPGMDMAFDEGQMKIGRRLSIKLLNASKFALRSEEHTSELQSLMRISYAVFCLKKKKKH